MNKEFISSFEPLQQKLKIVCVLLIGLILTACDGGKTPDLADYGGEIVDENKRETIFGEGGLTFGDAQKPNPGASSSGIGVNAYLWRATLDTMSVWPITSADPFGGVIITDWYAPPATPNERFKMNIYILDRALRADGVRVSVFRQIRNGATWQDTNVQPATATQLENAILMRARQFRNQGVKK